MGKKAPPMVWATCCFIGTSTQDCLNPTTHWHPAYGELCKKHAREINEAHPKDRAKKVPPTTKFHPRPQD